MEPGGGAGSGQGGSGKAGTGGGASGSGGTSPNAGNSGAGGVSGSGGSGGFVCGDVVDDVEDGDGFIPKCDGRVGYWYTFTAAGSIDPPITPSGASATPTLIPSGMTHEGSSQWAMHVSGTGTDHGVLGIDIVHDGATYGVYDASRYTGVRFYAKGDGPIIMRVPSTATTYKVYGGTCPSGCMGNGALVGLGATWQLFSVPFSALTGGTGPFEQDKLTSIQFFPESPTFDFWIDDPTFY